MKKILIIGIMLFTCIAAKAQQYQQAPGYLYSYDANGNRTMREYKMINIQATKIIDSTAQHGDSASVIAANQAAQQLQQQQQLSETLPNGQQITVFPNPTEGVLQIDITNFATGSKGYILATDMQGRLVYKSENINATNKIDFSTLAKGNYTLKLLLNDTTKEWVIIKQ